MKSANQTANCIINKYFEEDQRNELLDSAISFKQRKAFPFRLLQGDF